MTSLVVAVFVASLLGSFHCAGMCGAFVAIACGATERNRTKQWNLAAAYHVGRLATYVSLGLAAGTLGRLVNLTGALAGLRSAAAALAAFTILLFALVALARAGGAALPRPPLPAAWLRLIQSAHRAVMDCPPMARAVAIGLLTTLLPCGWLYAFVVTAAGTGRPLAAALVMAVFWTGTLPALTAVGVGAWGLLGPAGRRLPTVTALAVAAVAIFMLVGRARFDPAALAKQVESTTSFNSAPDPAIEKACCRVKRAEEGRKIPEKTP